MTKSFLTLSFLFSLSSFAAVIELHKIKAAKLYDLQDTNALLFSMERTDETTPSTNHITTTYKDPKGEVAVIEHSYAENGQFKKYVVDQRQLGTLAAIEVQGSEVHFSLTSKDGKAKKAVEKLKDNFVTSPTIVSYLQKNWSAITEGKSVGVRYGVPDRLETVGFEFKKVAEKEVNGKVLWSIRMKPSSFLIAALVNPLHFYFEPDGSKLIQIEGRVPPKRPSGSHFKDLDARSVYEY